MSTDGAAMRWQGINYDTGTRYGPDADSRPDWSPSTLRRQIGTIADELHANAVNVFGSDPNRLHDAARVGLENGLTVWVQPRLPDADQDTTIAHLAEVAEVAEALRVAGGDVRVNVGCEFTIFTAGLIPGRGFERRAARLAWMWPLLPAFNWRLNRLLAQAATTARERFGGEITYAAGSWESVAWGRFDAVGLNHYRDASNYQDYATVLRLARRHHKPVLVTEFGCCSYPGADTRGAEGDGIIDWDHADGPVVVGDHPRDETVQARYIADLLDTFAVVGVDGAFVFEYSEPLYERRDDHRVDLDVASFGIVAVETVDTPDGLRYRETPKAAFAEIATRYRDAYIAGGDPRISRGRPPGRAR